MTKKQFGQKKFYTIVSWGGETYDFGLQSVDMVNARIGRFAKEKANIKMWKSTNKKGYLHELEYLHKEGIMTKMYPSFPQIDKYIYGPLAQWSAQVTHNDKVSGSSPEGTTIELTIGQELMNEFYDSGNNGLIPNIHKFAEFYDNKILNTDYVLELVRYYMKKKYHPHCTLIANQNVVEILEGIKTNVKKED